MASNYYMHDGPPLALEDDDVGDFEPPKFVKNDEEKFRSLDSILSHYKKILLTGFTALSLCAVTVFFITFLLYLIEFWSYFVVLLPALAPLVLAIVGATAVRTGNITLASTFVLISIMYLIFTMVYVVFYALFIIAYTVYWMAELEFDAWVGYVFHLVRDVIHLVLISGEMTLLFTFVVGMLAFIIFKIRWDIAEKRLSKTGVAPPAYWDPAQIAERGGGEEEEVPQPPPQQQREQGMDTGKMPYDVQDISTVSTMGTVSPYDHNLGNPHRV